VLHNGGIARTAGIVFRFVDPQDFYFVEADAIAGRVRLVRIVNGERRELARHAAALAVGKAQTLKFKAVDNSFAVSLDGSALFETHDSVPAARGRFGIWTRGDSQTSFGDLFITTLD